MPETELDDIVREALARRIGPEAAAALDSSTAFEDIGIDSIDVVVVIAELEREFPETALSGVELAHVGLSIGTISAHLRDLREKGRSK